MTAAPPSPPSEAVRPAPARRRVRTPTLLQMEAAECGAAALGIVLAHHGRWVPLEELRVECGVSRDGSKAVNIVRAARRYGLDAAGWKEEPENLFRFLPPFIVFWNFNHFLVVEGWDGRRVYLNDPAQGPVAVSRGEFDESYTGVAMTFEKGADFRPGGRRPAVLPALRARLAGSEPALVYVLLTGLCLLFLQILAPTFSGIFIDQYLVKGLSLWVIPLLWIMGGAALLQGAATWLQEKALLRLHVKLSLGTSSQFFWHVLRLPMEFFSQRFGGEIGSRVALNEQVAGLLSGQLASTMIDLCTIAFYAALLFSYDWLLTGLGVGIAAANLLFVRLVNRLAVDANRRLLQEQGKLIATAMGGLQIIETVKATGGEGDLFARYAGHLAKVVNAQQGLERLTHGMGAVSGFLNALSSAAILGVGGYRVIRGDLSMGMFVVLQGLLGAFLSPFSKLVGLSHSLQEIQGTIQRLNDVLGAKLDPEVDDGAVRRRAALPAEGGKLQGRLELRGLTFGYSRLAPPLLSGFDLVVEPGARVALVGGSGSGKSTVGALVMGLYRPWSGQVLFDGRPREEISRSVLTASLGCVSQDITLFSGTLLDNLRMWDRTLSEEAVMRAARDACIHDAILSRPGGYHGRVDEAGANFSGGQRQRIEIARALALDPAILVLDEATSALDAATEAEVDSNLRRRGCTCLIIAHRLSTIRDADLIVVLGRGGVLEQGTHEQLKDAGGAYAELIHA